MSGKAKLSAGLTILAALAVLAAGWLLSGLNDGRTATTTPEPEPAATPRKPAATPRPETAPGRSVAATASAACVDLAPRTLKAYMGEDRSRLKGPWFTEDAQGLDVPVSGIAPQPVETFTGSLNTGADRSMAVCSVWTGLESPWILQYRYTNEAGWLAVMVQGPAEGAYTLSGGPRP